MKKKIMSFLLVFGMTVPQVSFAWKLPSTASLDAVRRYVNDLNERVCWNRKYHTSQADRIDGDIAEISSQLLDTDNTITGLIACQNNFSIYVHVALGALALVTMYLTYINAKQKKQIKVLECKQQAMIDYFVDETELLPSIEKLKEELDKCSALA
jgi:hypothetical protein